MKIRKIVHHGKTRWRVNDSRGTDGKRQRKFFETKEEAEKFIRQLKTDRHALGMYFSTIPIALQSSRSVVSSGHLLPRQRWKDLVQRTSHSLDSYRPILARGNNDIGGKPKVSFSVPYFDFTVL